MSKQVISYPITDAFVSEPFVPRTLFGWRQRARKKIMQIVDTFDGVFFSLTIGINAVFVYTNDWSGAYSIDCCVESQWNLSHLFPFYLRCVQPKSHSITLCFSFHRFLSRSVSFVHSFSRCVRICLFHGVWNAIIKIMSKTSLIFRVPKQAFKLKLLFKWFAMQISDLTCI